MKCSTVIVKSENNNIEFQDINNNVLWIMKNLGFFLSILGFNFYLFYMCFLYTFLQALVRLVLVLFTWKYHTGLRFPSFRWSLHFEGVIFCLKSCNLFTTNPAGNYMLKDKSRNIRTRCETHSKLTFIVRRTMASLLSTLNIFHTLF